MTDFWAKGTTLSRTYMQILLYYSVTCFIFHHSGHCIEFKRKHIPHYKVFYTIIYLYKHVSVFYVSPP